MTTNQFCTFRVSGYVFGVDVDKVQEVIRFQEMTEVPLASAEIRGLINLRGEIVTAMDLRRRLQFPDRTDGELPMNVVVRTDDGPVSLLVDAIEDVLEVGDEVFERPPETVAGIASELIRGAYKLEEHLLLVLDTDKVVSFNA